MPYVLRDPSGRIVRATLHAVHGAEVLPYGHAELDAFLKDNGQSPREVDQALSELRRTDADMSRAIEDVVMALFKKNILKMSDLPKPVQDRMALRVKLRVMIQEAFDKASHQAENPDLSPQPDPAPAPAAPIPAEDDDGSLF